ncbi:universal stress protein E [Escherichia coli]|uniref:Universal stress protein E n=1 Tax=Escherichia coli TaxID=562 RepID=A0A485JFI9_ECOLX|nr:universal stress protein E [Escherichia coli]
MVWHNRPFEAIIQEVISGGHDLVLKMAHQHDRLEAVIFTPTDWHLLRKCPSPVWMVKDQPWPEGGKALVAVNLASEEPYIMRSMKTGQRDDRTGGTSQPYRSSSGWRLSGNAN